MKLALQATTLSFLLTAAPALNAFDLGSAVNAASALSSKTASSSSSESTSLVSMLTQQLGVTETQATGGTAALLGKAKSAMSSTDYAGLLSAVPELSSFSGGSGTSMLDSLGGDSLTQQFSALGMDSSMVGKFVPILLDYVNTSGGSEMTGMLKSALGF